MACFDCDCDCDLGYSSSSCCCFGGHDRHADVLVTVYDRLDTTRHQPVYETHIAKNPNSPRQSLAALAVQCHR